MIRVALLMVALASPGTAGEVQVLVGNVRGTTGTIRVALCPEKSFPGFDCPYFSLAPATPGTTDLRIPDVVPGTYAAEAFHDTDNSGKLETDFFGRPRKAIGFSRNAPMRFGPPRFADAAVTIGPGGGRVTVELRYPE